MLFVIKAESVCRSPNLPNSLFYLYFGSSTETFRLGRASWGKCPATTDRRLRQWGVYVKDLGPLPARSCSALRCHFLPLRKPCVVTSCPCASPARRRPFPLFWLGNHCAVTSCLCTKPAWSLPATALPLRCTAVLHDGKEVVPTP